MASQKEQNHPKGPLRTLRRMLSLDRLTPPSLEEVGGYRVRSEVEMEDGGGGKSVAAGPEILRRQSLTREAQGREGDTGGGVEEARIRLLRLKSYPPVSHHETPPTADEKKVRVVENALPHRNRGTAPRHAMSEESVGKGGRAPALPPLAMPRRGILGPRSAPVLRSSNPEKKMDELLECAVCLERLQDPRTLPCDHTFCLKCLQVQGSSPLGAHDNSAGVIKCPTCRREAVIPRHGGIASFPTNVYLESLLHLLSERGHTSPTTPPQTPLPSTNGCSKCGSNGQLQLYICGHCQQVLCKECLPEHSKEMKEEMLAIQEKIKGVTLRLEEAEKEFSARFEQLRSQVEAEREQRLARVADDSRRLLERVGALEAARLQGGCALRERLHNALESCSENVFEDTASESKVEMLLKARREATGLLTEASRWSEQAQSPLTFDRANFRILDPEDEEDEEEAEDEGEEDEEETEEEEEVEEGGGRERGGGAVIAQQREPDARGRGGGEEAKRRREGEGGPRRRSAARALPGTHDELSLYYRSRAMTSPRWRWGGSRSSGNSAPGELYRPSGLSVAPWRGGSELYVAASDGGRVSVFARRSGGSGWKYLRTLSAPPPRERMLCPFGVAFSEARAEVYVTDKWCHCIHVYDSEGTWLRRLCKSGRGPGCLSSPEGIAASDEHIFVADTGNDRVQALNAADGSFVTFVGSDPSSIKREQDTEPSPGSGYLTQPTGVALSVDLTKLVVCDSGHNRIKIFDTSGLRSGDPIVPSRPVCVFGSLGSQKGQLRTARGVAIDRMGFVVVADSGNARVQIFRPNGTLVRVFGSKGKEPGQFGYPIAVHVGPLFELFVSDATNHSVSVF